MAIEASEQGLSERATAPHNADTRLLSRRHASRRGHTVVATPTLADDTGRALGSVDGAHQAVADPDGRPRLRGGGLPARRPITSWRVA